jgi:HSP20 family molecular chaperone IbpA
MGAQSATQRREVTKQVKFVRPDATGNRKNEIRDMIARRAYELFESRGRIHGNDLDDWVHAELEILHSCRHELKVTAGAVIFLIELPGSFTADQISVSVEPRRLTVSGERELEVICGGTEPAHTEKRTQRIFLVEGLPMDVDASRTAAKLEGGMLAIVMPKLDGIDKPSEKAVAGSPKR